jgi:acetyl-CoA carboxylase biotin carboxyl carrier protein
VGKEIVTYDELLRIVELIRAADSFSEFHLKIGDIELDLRRSATSVAADAAPTFAAAPPAIASAPVTSSASTASASPGTGASASAPAQAHRAVAAAGRAPVEVPAGCVAIRSPMVGTFYRAPEPGARPFVEVGQSVNADTTLCIIEVMKLMNSIPAGCAGKITHVLVDDAEPVDAGQVLIVIDPKG